VRGAEFLAETIDHGLDVRQIAVLDGEADVRRVVVHHVLDDVVDNDVARGDIAENLRGNAGTIRHGFDRHAGEVFLEGGAGYDDVFHVRSLRDDPRAFVVVLAIAHVDAHVVLLGEFDGARLQHAGAKAGQLQHLVVADLVDLARVLADARISRIDAVDVGVILAHVRLQHSAHGNERRIAPAAAERREIALGRDALKAGDDHDLAFIELIEDALLIDRLDAGLTETRCR